jgi:hypothetical protein
MMINHRSLHKIFIPIVILTRGVLAFAPSARAEIPPGSYDKLRISAEEALVINVTTVNSRPASNREFTLVSVKARVVAVERSKQGLKSGTEISIQYESRHPNSKMAGARRIEILRVGEYYPAFLNISDDRQNYSPAAYGESFKMTPRI